MITPSAAHELACRVVVLATGLAKTTGTIYVFARRKSDGFYLNSAGTWSSGVPTSSSIPTATHRDNGRWTLALSTTTTGFLGAGDSVTTYMTDHETPASATVLSDTIEHRVDALAGGQVSGVAGDVGGKVLGGGASSTVGVGVRAVDSSANALATAAAQTSLASAVAVLPQDKAGYALSSAGITAIWGYASLGLSVLTWLVMASRARAANRWQQMNAIGITPIDATHSTLSGYTFDATTDAYVGAWLVVASGQGFDAGTGLGSIAIIQASSGGSVTHSAFSGAAGAPNGSSIVIMFRPPPDAADLSALLDLPSGEVWTEEQRDAVVAATTEGLGAGVVTVTVEDGDEDPIPGFRLYLRDPATGLVKGQGLTDEDGQVLLAHEGGPYQLVGHKTGWTLPVTAIGPLTVGQALSQTITAVPVAVSPAEGPAECTLFAMLRNPDGTPGEGVKGTVKVDSLPQVVGGNFFIGQAIEAVADATGLIAWTVPRRARLEVSIVAVLGSARIHVPNAATADLAELI